MNRRKKTKENYPEKKSSVRIWPGVLVITAFACILFLLVNYLGYKAGLLTLPGFLQSFITVQQDEADHSGEGNDSRNLQSGLTAAETEYAYYDPQNAAPAELLQSLEMARSFHQRMRFSAMGQSGSSSWLVNLYTADACWRIEQENTLFISNGESLWRGSTDGNSYRTQTGTFTWNNHLGIPTLRELQAYGKENPDKVDFRETERTVYVEYHPGENSRIQCHIAVDTGLVTEMQVYVNDSQVLSMYTERTTVSPDICEDKSMFTWTDQKNNG